MKENKLSPWFVDGEDELDSYKFNIILKEIKYKIPGKIDQEIKKNKLNNPKMLKQSRANKISYQLKSAQKVQRHQYPQNITQIDFSSQQKVHKRNFYLKHLHISKPRHSMFLKRQAKQEIDSIRQGYSPVNQIQRKNKKLAKQEQSENSFKSSKRRQIFEIDTKINSFLPKKIKTEAIEELPCPKKFQQTFQTFERRYQVENTISIQRKIFLLKNGNQINNKPYRKTFAASANSTNAFSSKKLKKI